MLSLLKKSHEINAIVSLFFDRAAPGSPVIGKVVCCNEEHIVISAISPIGMWDGYQLRRTQDLFKIEGKGEYEEKIQTLFEKRGGALQQHPLTFSEGDNLIDQVIGFARKDIAVIGLGLEGSEEVLSGFLQPEEDVLLRLSLLNQYGRDDGYACIPKEDIDFMELHSVECRSLGYLWAARSPK